ncbi:MAG TPA: hypothetical protein VF860_14520, partial [Candidatus Acidoferrales bacterium]
SAGVQALGKNLREGGFTDADWTLQGDEPRGPESRAGRLTRRVFGLPLSCRRGTRLALHRAGL